MKKCLFLFFPAWLLSAGCSVLTPSQVKNINAFATAAKKYSYYPGEVIKKRADLVLEEKLVGAIQLPPDQIKVSIANAQKNYESQQKLADKFDLSLRLIRQYASLLDKLSSAEFVEDLTSSTNDLNDNLSGLVNIANEKFSGRIPAKTGGAITKAIFLVGERLTRNKQAKALKEFIPSGDTLIKITVKNLTDALNTDLPDVLAGDKEKFINTYTNNILVKESKVEYNSLRQYLVALNNYDNLEQLRKKSIEAAEKLSAAHAKLYASIGTKSNLKEIFQETQDFIISTQELYKTFDQLSFNGQSKKP